MSRRHRSPVSCLRPRLECLETRCLPSVLTVTSTADSGAGSLRAALASAQSGDAIKFALPNPSTIQLASSLQVLTGVDIAGPGAAALTIKGNQTFTIFAVNGGPSTISGLTVSHGGGTTGGGIANGTTLTLAHCVITGSTVTGNGGGIENFADLTINDCTISQNTAAAGGGVYAFAPGFLHAVTTIAGSTISGNTATSQTSAATGGGVENLATLSIINSSVTNNLANGGSGMGAGGGIADEGPMVIQNSHIDFNRAEGGASGVNGIGGGIDLQDAQAASGATVTILDSSISSNIAAGNGSTGSGDGGGLSDIGAGGNLGLPITVLDSTIANNQALGGGGSSGAGDAVGGGLNLLAPLSATLANCTISGNSAVGGNTVVGTGGSASAGGIIWDPATSLGDLIADCTIAGNAAIAGTGSTGVPFSIAGGIIVGAPTDDLTNTIVAANHAAFDADIDGTSSTASFNLIGDGTGTMITNGVNGNQVGTTASPIDPKLGPLANYGGPTQTQNLLPGSPAIDAGTNQGPLGTTDQRGYPRIYNVTVDIGAYEFQPFHFLCGPGRRTRSQGLR
jgi:hypothetical protein